MKALSNEVKPIVRNSMQRESQVANLPAHPPRRKVGIQVLVLEVVRLHRSKAIQPIFKETKVASPMLKKDQASTQRCALFAEPNIPCGDAVNLEH